MTPTRIPTLPISIYPETWQKANDVINQFASPGVIEGIVVGLLILVGLLVLIKRIRQV